MFSWTAPQKYVPLQRGERSLGRQSCYALLLLCLLAITFFLGQVSHRPPPSAALELGLTQSKQTLVYQKIYGQRPSDLSDQAWEALFPEHGGFFRHPTVAPKRAVFSVYHQLHCLNGLRRGYWVMNDAAQSGVPFNASNLPMEASESHIRHCIDLLRQVLMCQPDLTVEYKDEARGGVHGFGTSHTCYNWEQLVDWTRDWQDFD